MPRTLAFLALPVLAAALSACGARTSLISPSDQDGGRPPLDGGRDAGRDGGFDAGRPDGGTLVVDCGRTEQFTTPRRPIMLEGTATGPDPVVRQEWTLVTSPPGALPILDVEPEPNRITITPLVLGEHLMRFSVVDAAGRSASCEVRVQAVVGPPIAICPEGELRGIIDVPVLIMGDGFDDDMVVAFSWELISAPPGAMPRLVGLESPLLELTSGTRGRYRLRLTVVDPDMATDSCEVEVLLTGPPEVTCPMGPINAPTRRPVSVMATAVDDLGIASERWELLAQPPGSTATLMPTDANPTRITPDKQGRYQLRYTATDVEGLSASCEVTVIGTPTPPELTCPMVVTTPPLVPVEIVALAVDDGRIVSWSWRVMDRPMGSAAGPPSPANAARTRFTPDIAGIYLLTVTVTDDDGMTAMCTTRVEAGNVDGLRVEMFWGTDGTDMDLHLLNPTGTRWVGMDDCYYGNCNTSSSGGSPILSWGPGGLEDDPRLDLDDTNGFGPENINIERPVVGTYRVAVHNFRGGGANNTTVRIYCGGSTTMPRQTFGPVSLPRSGNDFWRVADVTITAGGCTITDLTRADGRPWIETYSGTTGMR